MKPSLFVLAAMWGHYRALTVLFSGSDILRLRTMTTLALAFSAMCIAVGPGWIVATFMALAACRLHPDLRLRPFVPGLLLMLTPAWALSAVLAATFGNSAFALDPESWAWLQATAPLVLGLAALCLPWPGLSWQRRLLSSSLCVSIAAAALSQDPVLWAMLAAAGLAAGWRCGLFDGMISLSHALRPLSAIVMAFGLALAASAGPWTQSEGEELVIVRAPVSRQSNADGALSVQIYSEAGVSDDVSFVSSGYQEVAGERTRAGGSAGLRVALWREDDWIFSSEASAGIEPFSLAESGGWKRHAQGDVRVLAGWSGSLDELPVYASAEAGWRFRPAEFDDAIVLAASAGIDLYQDVQINVHASLVHDLSGEDTAFAQAGVVWRVDDWIGLELGVQGFADDTGETSAQAIAGLWLRF